MAEFEDVQDSKKSFVRKYFWLNKAEQKSKCALCNSILKSTGGSRRSLIDHLKKEHQVAPKWSAAEDQDDALKKPKVGLIQSYFTAKKESLGQFICNLICKDGLNFNKLRTSERPQVSFKANCYSFPKSPHTLTDLFLNEFENMKCEFNDELAALKVNNRLMSFAQKIKSLHRNCSPAKKWGAKSAIIMLITN